MKGNAASRQIVLGVLLLAFAALTAWSVSRGPGVEPAPMDELLAEAGEAGMESAVTWDLTMTRNEHVEQWIGFLTGRNADRTRLWLERSGMYGPMIQEELRARGMPQDLLYLALIESGFSPRATSVAAAVGIWQFIAETGRRYGLEVSADLDERRDPVKSTTAALDYLEELYARFDSWYLAAAAYNTGENRVGRIMREEFGTERGTDDHFWKIAHRLPRETRNYVPLMLAAGHIAKEPHLYGFDGLEYQDPLAYDEVWVPGGTPVALVARAAGVPEAAVDDLNPQLLRQRTPAARSWAVRIPAGTADRFAASFPSLYEQDRLAQLTRPAGPAVTAAAASASASASGATHRVARGETLSHIALRHGVSVAALRSANGNLDPRRLRAGQTLRIPGGSVVQASTRAAPASVRIHQVRRGENLTVIARRYNTSITRIQSLNNMGGSTRIVAGQRLRVG
jgi:membrane-bound lytic murein transglycosylase D